MTTPALTQAERDELKRALEQRRRQLRGQLEDHLHGQTSAERAHDVLMQDGDDAPQRLPEREIAGALNEHEQREIAAIDVALQRVAQGDYGICVDCSCNIPVARLRAEPWAARCITCATKREQAARL